MDIPIIKYYILLIFVILSAHCYSQQIEIHLSDYNGKLYLSALSGEKTELIDSISTGDDQNYRFLFDITKYHYGFYRLSFGSSTQFGQGSIPSGWIDFLYVGENVNIKTDARNILDSMKIISSESNRLYYQFIKLNKAYKSKTELLLLMLSRFPKDDEYYNQTKKRLNELQSGYMQFVNVTSQTNPNAFIAEYIRSVRLPVVDSSVQPQQQLVFLKAHALDNVDFDNNSLIYSDAFTNKTIEYLTYYRNRDLPLESLENEFINAVDSILGKAKVNQMVYRQIVEYLIDGFKKFGFDKVLDYIVENYVIKDDICLDSKTEGLIKHRIDQAKTFKVGSIVPNITLTDTAGNIIELNKITAEKTLIVFYASWCPHCKDLLPKLNELYKNRIEKNFEVFSIALDTNRKDWTDFITNNKLSFINVSDLKGWDGKAATDYFIYATPTMFMIDQQLRIISKPVSLEEVNSTILSHF
jgi:peroxiredoxin